jgi:hypothetical protein
VPENSGERNVAERGCNRGEVRTEEAERAGSKEMMDEQHHPHLPSRYIYLSPGQRWDV